MPSVLSREVVFGGVHADAGYYQSISGVTSNVVGFTPGFDWGRRQSGVTMLNQAR